jgi:hypothetical protein
MAKRAQREKIREKVIHGKRRTRAKRAEKPGDQSATLEMEPRELTAAVPAADDGNV